MNIFLTIWRCFNQALKSVSILSIEKHSKTAAPYFYASAGRDEDENIYLSREGVMSKRFGLFQSFLLLFGMARGHDYFVQCLTEAFDVQRCKLLKPGTRILYFVQARI